MPGSADFIQRAVHAMEAGGLAVWIRRGLVVVVIAAIGVFYFINQFRGLATAQAMDQAQIGRAIANGQGWSTKFARPVSIVQLQGHGKNVATYIWIDSYNAPLPALVNAIALIPVKSHLYMTSSEVVYIGDKAIVLMAIILFLLSLAVLFFLVRRVFDQRVAILTCALIVLCDAIWQYSLSGLPQMLLLLLFNVMLYFLVRAVEAKYAGKPVTLWLIAVGVSFGLLALTHALTIWIFVALLIYSIFFFKPRFSSAGILLGAFALVYFPWLIRTYAVSGNPAGVATYSAFDGILRSETVWMRQLFFSREHITLGQFRAKISGNLLNEFSKIYEYLGWNIVAVSFFFGLLHPFKRAETSAIRWLVLAMWGGAVIGMAVYGMSEEQGVSANQLHLLFIPIMAAFGFAYLLVQWNRLEIKIPFSRAAFIGLLYLLCFYPMLNTMLLSNRKPQVMYPPYIPPYISILRTWMKPNEIIASDMPWAVAWYADRRSVWLPYTISEFTDLSDYKTLGAPITGLYLTPISGSNNKYSDILRGEYRDWADIIQLPHDVAIENRYRGEGFHIPHALEKFPLKYATLSLGTNQESLFISDTDRTKIQIQ
jgi:4-amino-4-deoxy-L-arabinose transferase-like glycosyltransferase